MKDDEADAMVLAALAEAVTPVELPAGVRDRMRQRILAASQALPPPAGTQTFRSDDEGWIAPSEFIRMKTLRIDAEGGTQEVLIRFLPGVQVPAHSHTKEEQMVILEGECHVGDHPLRAGDIHVAPAGSWHPVITSKTGALLLLRCEYPFPAR